VACVIRRADSAVDEAELRAWCGRRLAPYKVPVRVLFRAAFPLTPTMRVAKDKLRTEILPLLGAELR
jgi:acyl-CoA synthetase (AMP-forming)/AMP-acid ligase II